MQRPWAPMLLDGSKVIETRIYDIDKNGGFGDEWFWVVETPGEERQRGQRAHITGCIKFSSEAVRGFSTHIITMPCAVPCTVFVRACASL